LPDSGTYDVYAYNSIHTADATPDRKYLFEYTLRGAGDTRVAVTLSSRDIIADITRPDGQVKSFNQKKEIRHSWLYLGRHELPSGETTLILHDRGAPGQLLVADAVKWVRVQNEVTR
jgi:hypothetical protein